MRGRAQRTRRLPRQRGLTIAQRFQVTRPSHQAAAHPIADNIRAIVQLERDAFREATLSERVGDRITRVAGTLMFAVAHAIAFACWASWNTLAPEQLRFDPYPFGLLTLIVSLEGVLVATFVLIAQNRMRAQSDQRDHLNLQIDLLAEQEMTLVLKMLRRIGERLGVEPGSLDERQAEKLAEHTNVHDLMQTLRRELPDENGS